MNVLNVAESRDWYRSYLGIEPIESLPDFVSFKISGTCLDITQADDKSPASTGGAVGYWLVDNLESALARARELGAQIYRGPLPVPEIGRVIAQIRDPFGNVFGLEAPL